MPVGLVCRLLLLVVLVVVLVSHPLVLRVPPRVQRKEEKHGKAGGAGLAELDFGGVRDRTEGAPSSGRLACPTPLAASASASSRARGGSEGGSGAEAGGGDADSTKGVYC